MTDRYIDRALWALIFLLSMLCVATAEARDATEDLALAFARVTFNEALDSEADQAMIWQVVSHHGSTDRQRLSWLRRHSPCVTGVLSQDRAYQRPGNCRWTRNLMPDGRRPRGWDRDLHGRWSWLRERWMAHYERAVEYVIGARRASVCAETPVSWDGRRYGRARIEARGWRILECSDELRNYAVAR